MSDAKKLRRAAKKAKRLRQLIRHCWVHSAYRDCGFMEMEGPMRDLYCKVIGRPESEREDR